LEIQNFDIQLLSKFVEYYFHVAKSVVWIRYNDLFTYY